MIRIICAKCKNAYLQNKDEKLVCPSCEATYPQEKENLLLGVQYYNEENFVEADNCLMKYIVANSSEPRALFYKAFCDARAFDEDTTSLHDTYKKIINAFDDASDEEFPELIAIANDKMEKIEKLLTENHVRLFADADAEKIKKQVEIILNIQSEAKAFRAALSALVSDFNERSPRKVSAKFSDCFFVEGDISAEVGEIKYRKICDNVASHTVFTGILTNDIKNLEIYFRCIVMFFQKSYDKYKFLLEQSEKFTKLAELLELGQYNTLKGTGAVADKLKSISYEFLQESYKEHFDEQIEMQTETVVIIEPEVIEEPEVVEEAAEAVEEAVAEIVEDTEAEVAEVEPTEEIEEATEELSDDTDVVEIDVQDAVEEIAEAEAEIDEEPNTDKEIIEESIADADIIEIDVPEAADDIDSASEEITEDATEQIEEISSVSEAYENSSEEVEATAEAAEEDAVIEISFEQEEADIVEASVTDDVDAVVVEEVILEDSESSEEKEELLNGDTEKTTATKAKKAKSHKGLVLVVLILALAGLFAAYKYVPNLINNYKYNKAADLVESGNYSEAVTAFKELGDYADSKEMATECEYNHALKLEEAGEFAEAKLIFQSLDIYADSRTRAQSCAYSEAKEALESKDFEAASKLFTELDDYGDSKEMVKECSYKQALALMEEKEYKRAIEILTTIRKYSDSKEKILEAKYMYVTDNFDKENKTTIKYLNELTTAGYRNCADLRQELLGSSQVVSDDIKAFVNYSSADLETSLTQLDNTKPIYFHVVVDDEALYGQTLTLKYTTAFGYSQRTTVVLSEANNTAVMSYPATQHKNYTVEFDLLDSTGKRVAGQKISF